MNLREHIFGLNDRPLTAVEVEEWECTVYVRKASAQEIENIQERIADFAKRKLGWSWRAWFLQQLLCEEDGKPVFSGDDFKKLSEKSGVVVSHLFKIAAECNGLVSGDSASEDSEVDDDPKNSSEETSDSGTAYL